MSAAKFEIKYLTPEQVRERWQGAVALQTLANWRCAKKAGFKGPPFVKIGMKVLYPIAQLEAWEQDNMQAAA